MARPSTCAASAPTRNPWCWSTATQGRAPRARRWTLHPPDPGAGPRRNRGRRRLCALWLGRHRRCGQPDHAWRNEEGVWPCALWRGDGYHERQLGGLAGFRWAGGNATFTYEKPTAARSTGWTATSSKATLTSQGGGDFRSTQCSPGNIVISGVTYPIPVGGITAAPTPPAWWPGPANKCDNFQVEGPAAFATPRQLCDDRRAKFGDLPPLRRRDRLQARYAIRPSAFTANLTVRAPAFYVRPPTASPARRRRSPSPSSTMCR